MMQKLTTKLKKMSLLWVFMLTILVSTPIMALASTPTPSAENGSPIMVADILSDVQSAQGSNSVDSLTTSAKTAGDSVVTFLRTLAIIGAVIAFVLVAYGLIFSPNVKTIADMKGRVGALVLAIIVAFMAEKIVGTLFMWLGIKAG